MIPSFKNWVENEENPALSEPQHKSGEQNLNLSKILEKRVKELLSELESSGKGSKQVILATLQDVLNGFGSDDQSRQPPQPQQNSPQQMQPPAINPSTQSPEMIPGVAR